jgi:hypothetical protein
MSLALETVAYIEALETEVKRLREENDTLRAKLRLKIVDAPPVKFEK